MAMFFVRLHEVFASKLSLLIGRWEKLVKRLMNDHDTRNKSPQSKEHSP